MEVYCVKCNRLMVQHVETSIKPPNTPPSEKDVIATSIYVCINCEIRVRVKFTKNDLGSQERFMYELGEKEHEQGVEWTEEDWGEDNWKGEKKDDQSITTELTSKDNKYK